MKTRLSKIAFFTFVICCQSIVYSQVTTLDNLFDLASKNNVKNLQTQQSVATNEYQLKAAKLLFLPDLNVSAGYTYLGKPLQIDMEQTRSSIIEGSSQQNVYAADLLYKDITGNNLSANAKQKIYEGSKSTLGGIYPNYNPTLSKQDYFTAGADLMVPFYLGGKQSAARQIAKQQLATSKIGQQVVNNAVDFSIVVQYLRIQYLNSMLKSQNELVTTYQSTVAKVNSMVSQNIIPPYQANWAAISLSQAQTQLQSFEMDQENAYLELNNLIGIDTTFNIPDTLVAAEYLFHIADTSSVKDNLDYQYLQAKSAEAKTLIKVNLSKSLPNIVGVANYQFLQRNLPVITPPWMVGIGVRWNIFSGFSNIYNIKASKSLYEESKLLLREKEQEVNTQDKIIRNQIQTAFQQLVVLDSNRKQAKLTVEMVQARLDNQMSSVKDLDDAMKMQLNADKAYYTALFTYNLSVATYLESKGEPRTMSVLLKK